MADLYGTVSPEYALEQQRLNRQQKMAEMLLASGSQPQSTGQMVSGRYVPNSFFQNLQGPVNMMLGAYMARKTDEKLGDEYKKLMEEKKGESERLAKALRGQEIVTEMAGPYGQGVGMGGANVPMPTAVKEGEPNFRQAIDVIMQNRFGTGREMLPALMQQAYPKPIAPTGDIANFQYMKEKGLIPANMTALQYQVLLKQADNKPEKAPAGYRFLPDGSLEAIKGGPADLKSQAKISGAEDVDKVIVDLRDKYNKLFEGGGITDPSLRVGSNLAASASQSPVGQFFGRALSTQNQSYRNQIATTRPLLMSAIMKATGMSAKQIDSNAELKLWLSTATDPNLDYETNMSALSNLENLFGTAALNKQQAQPNQPAATNQPTTPKQATTKLPSSSDIDAEIARRQQRNR